MSRRPGKSYARLDQLAREWLTGTGTFAPTLHLRATVPCRCMGVRIQNCIEKQFPNAQVVVDTVLVSQSSGDDLPWADFGYDDLPIEILVAEGVSVEDVLSLFQADNIVGWLADHVVRVDDDDGGDDARYLDRRGHIIGCDGGLWEVMFEDDGEQEGFACFQLSLISCPSW